MIKSATWHLVIFQACTSNQHGLNYSWNIAGALKLPAALPADERHRNTWFLRWEAAACYQVRTQRNLCVAASGHTHLCHNLILERRTLTADNWKICIFYILSWTFIPTSRTSGVAAVITGQRVTWKLYERKKEKSLIHPPTGCGLLLI